MKRRIRQPLIWLPATAIWAVVLGWPIIALFLRAFQSWSDPDVPLDFERLSVLFGKTVLLAAAGASGAVALSVPPAWVIGRACRKRTPPLLLGLLLVPLLCPPMIYAFGWQRLYGIRADGSAYFGGWLHVIGVWASWGWPIPALLVGAAWRRTGRTTYEAALLNCSPWVAFRRAALPLLRLSLLTSFLVLFALFLGEYSVPHACGVMVYATDLLGRATSSANLAMVVRPALPLAAIVLMIAGILIRYDMSNVVDLEVMENESAASRLSRRAVAFVAMVTGITVIVPIFWLIVSLATWGDLSNAFDTYRTELRQSCAIAVAAGLTTMILSIGVVSVPRLRIPGLLSALLMGILPAAITGQAAIAAYQPFEIIYNHWPLVVIGFTARFAWIGIGVAWLAWRLGASLREQASVDGAGDWAAAFKVRMAANSPLLLAGVAIVSVLSLAEIATASLVQVPSVGLISLILIEKFHRLEDGMMAALCLWLVLPSMAVAMLAARLGRNMPGA